MAPNPEQKVDTQSETQTSAPKTGVETTPGQTQLGQLLTEVTGNLTPEQEAKLKELYDKKKQKSAERDQLVVEANGYKTAETWVNNPESTIPGLDNLVVMPKIDQKVEDSFKLQEADLKSQL